MKKPQDRLFRRRTPQLLLLIAATLYGAHAPANDFVLKDSSGQKRSAMLLSASADVKVNGLIVFGTLTQKYLNNGPDFIAGEYVFPLPEGATIDSLRVKVGGRVITSELKEKQAAKAQFEQAKREGKRAALLTQERENLFRMGVANIPAGEQIEVELSYLDTVHIDNQQYSLRLPTTLTPRYNPLPDNNTTNEESPSGLSIRDSLESFLNPPFIAEAVDAAGMPSNPLAINIELDAGFDLQNLHSDSHDIQVQDIDGSHQRIQFSQSYEPMDRDFVLQWQQNNTEMTPSLYYEQTKLTPSGTAESRDSAVENTVMLNLTPTAEHFKPAVLPKDVSFIIDTSGSMGGESIRQAKAALNQALDLLSATDSFNVIEFNSSHSRLFDAAQTANADNLRRARQFVASLVADGGTEMKPALLAAFRQQVSSAEHLKQVVFITDGAVGNEAELSRVVHQFIGDSRLFSIAIGSAPNQYLFNQLSSLGRGSSISIDNMQDVEANMQALFNKINAPAMRNIRLLDSEGKVLEVQPSVVPDVYFGEPLELLLRTTDLNGSITVRGELADKTVSYPLQLSEAKPAPGVAKLWGKEKINSLMNKIHLNQGEPEALEQEVIELSLKHNILSRYTSFVAVDKQAVRKPDQALQEMQIANLLPKGMALPQTALGTTPITLLSVFSLLLAGLIKRKSAQQNKATGKC